MLLEIEMGDVESARYGVIHKAGCRDLRDPEPIGEASAVGEACRLADDTTDWEYLAEGDTYRFAPCAARGLELTR